MKSNLSTSSKISWESPLSALFKGKSLKTLEKLEAIGVKSLRDLLWIFPLRIQILPVTAPFNTLREGELFRGQGKVISHQTKPNFRARGKGRALLHNITVIVQDKYSSHLLNLRWFNAYSSLNDKIKKNDLIAFSGIIHNYQGQVQIVNPEFGPIETDAPNEVPEYKIQYPTINKLGPAHIKKVFDKIPEPLWDEIEDSLPEDILERRQLMPLKEAFKVMHGKIPIDEFSDALNASAEDRLIYEEFYQEQIKIHLRRTKLKAPKGIEIKISSQEHKKAQELFPFQFTPDQDLAVQEILQDLSSGRPMMRLIQGDVGCGKTAVALCVGQLIIQKGYQVALMCPTEALAFQHFQSAQDSGISCELLIGSLKPAEKKHLQEKIKQGKPGLIIGTHALIQEAVEIPNLALAIIDEQHKFGVDQRLKLVHKNTGAHCLIMTATPIPRSLSLTQYGDLDITTIKTMPLGRKGHQTRIITPQTLTKFLSFFLTRLKMGEQAYVVVPAIEESETHDMQNLNETVENYKKFFPDQTIVGLHGKMKTDEKMQAFQDFRSGKTKILIATSVIEVGINVTNATILAILSPERFGLSSLHQLRGRVGRGDKPGFCFLVCDKQVSQQSLERLKVIENHTDGFKISEEDLRIRGEGDLFGKEQSGAQNTRRLANIITHYSTLEQVREDLEIVIQHNPEYLSPYIEKLARDERIFSTV